MRRIDDRYESLEFCGNKIANYIDPLSETFKLQKEIVFRSGDWPTKGKFDGAQEG